MIYECDDDIIITLVKPHLSYYLIEVYGSSARTKIKINFKLIKLFSKYHYLTLIKIYINNNAYEKNFYVYKVCDFIRKTHNVGIFTLT